MPTVLRIGPYRIYWYSNEANEPPHVHVDRGMSSAKFWLRPVRPARNVGYKPHELRRIRDIVESQKEYLLEAWYGHFG